MQQLVFFIISSTPSMKTCTNFEPFFIVKSTYYSSFSVSTLTGSKFMQIDEWYACI